MKTLWLATCTLATVTWTLGCESDESPALTDVSATDVTYQNTDGTQLSVQEALSDFESIAQMIADDRLRIEELEQSQVALATKLDSLTLENAQLKSDRETVK